MADDKKFTEDAYEQTLIALFRNELGYAYEWHAFDLRRVSSVTVRRFETPFEFQTLDGTMRSIDPAMLMICTGDTPVAIAGVMGGLDSEIEDDTDACLIESANFDGVSIRKTSSRLGLRTDASMRYEKILDAGGGAAVRAYPHSHGAYQRRRSGDH